MEEEKWAGIPTLSQESIGHGYLLVEGKAVLFNGVTLSVLTIPLGEHQAYY